MRETIEYEAIDYLLGSGVSLRYYKSFKTKLDFEGRWFLLSSEDKIGSRETLLSEKVVDTLLMLASSVKEKVIKREEIMESSSQKRALVIDDSSTIRSYHEALLKSFSFLVDTAENGMDAIEKSLKSEYDLILCDVNMPVMDGFEFVKKFRKSNRDTPVIFITTLDSDSDRRVGLLSGANLYIVKPIDTEILREILDSISK